MEKIRPCAQELVIGDRLRIQIVAAKGQRVWRGDFGTRDVPIHPEECPSSGGDFNPDDQRTRFQEPNSMKGEETMNGQVIYPEVSTFGMDHGAPAADIPRTSVNAAFFQEIKEDNSEMRQLLAAIESHVVDLWSDRHQQLRFTELLGKLRSKVATQFTLEEAYGYFTEPKLVAQEFSHRAERLRDQHSRLSGELREIDDFARQMLTGLLPRKFRSALAQRILLFCRDFYRHECSENELITDAFNQDFGVGD